jgi:hypothetical protein
MLVIPMLIPMLIAVITIMPTVATAGSDSRNHHKNKSC